MWWLFNILNKYNQCIIIVKKITDHGMFEPKNVKFYYSAY